MELICDVSSYSRQWLFSVSISFDVSIHWLFPVIVFFDLTSVPGVCMGMDIAGRLLARRARAWHRLCLHTVPSVEIPMLMVMQFLGSIV